jgi:hypothetical protein
VFQDLLVGSDAGLSVRQPVQLGNLLQAAGRSGFPVRVAIIARSDNLGAVTALWRWPQTYARFLRIELAPAYQQRLLVVIPNAFGFNWPGHSSGPSYAVLSRISIKPGGSGLLGAAQNAVRALAAAAKLGQSEQTRGGPGPALGASRSDGSASGRGDLVIVDERSRDGRAAAGGSLRGLPSPGSQIDGASCAGRSPVNLRATASSGRAGKRHARGDAPVDDPSFLKLPHPDDFATMRERDDHPTTCRRSKPYVTARSLHADVGLRSPRIRETMGGGSRRGSVRAAAR